MEQRYLIDTNIVSDYLSAALPSKAFTLMDVVLDATPNISIITQIELLCWQAQPKVELQVKEFVNDSIVIELSPDIITQCVAIRRERKVKIPDAIIAATAIVEGFTLITNNEKDFNKISGLTILNPHKI